MNYDREKVKAALAHAALHECHGSVTNNIEAMILAALGAVFRTPSWENVAGVVYEDTNERDAARYRWIRNNWPMVFGKHGMYTGAALDDTCDGGIASLHD